MHGSAYLVDMATVTITKENGMTTKTATIAEHLYLYGGVGKAAAALMAERIVASSRQDAEAIGTAIYMSGNRGGKRTAAAAAERIAALLA